MTPAEILCKIVEADKNAREVFNSTTQLRDGFDGYIQEHLDQISKQLYEQADKRVAEADKKATEQADEAIAASDARLKNELAAATEHYCCEKDAVIDKIFHMAVNINA
jgi:F0F1-type ATP synthase membrane subunit b/b'